MIGLLTFSIIYPKQVAPIAINRKDKELIIIKEE